MRAFVVLGLFFSTPRQETGLGKRLQNDLGLDLQNILRLRLSLVYRTIDLRQGLA